MTKREMFTNLENVDKMFNIDSSEMEKNIRQRKELGISDSDLFSFTEYLDEVIYNGITRLVLHDNCLGPEYLSDDEWRTILEKMYSISERIYKNNIAEIESDINSFDSYKDCLDYLDNLSAESYALRAELFDYLNVFHDYIYLR